MLESSADMRLPASLPILGILLAAFPAQKSAVSSQTPPPTPGKFTDVTSALGVHFQNLSSHTSKKYLPETMGAGVALFDYDNDGRLDIYLVNGAPLSDPTPKGTIPQKTGPEYWNRLYHQKPDGTFEDVTEKAGLAGCRLRHGSGRRRLRQRRLRGPVTSPRTAATSSTTTMATAPSPTSPRKLASPAAVGRRAPLGWTWTETACSISSCCATSVGFRRRLLRRAQRRLGALLSSRRLSAHCAARLSQRWPRSLHRSLAENRAVETGQRTRASRSPTTIATVTSTFSSPTTRWSSSFITTKADGTFEEVGLDWPVWRSTATGEPTRAWASISLTTTTTAGPTRCHRPRQSAYALYQNNGDGTFTYASFTSGIGRDHAQHSGWGVRFLDYDNDGWKDLLIAQGHDLDTIETQLPQSALSRADAARA